MNRLDVHIPSGKQLLCAAWLYLPDDSRPAPVIVMAHGLGGVRTMRLDAFAERFTAAGYACLVFDYRHFGSSEGEPRQLLDIYAQLADWRAAISYARGCALVDGSRVVLWGTSFGGGHVLAIAAGDKNLAAAIAQCPFTDGLASSFALHPISLLKVTVRALRDQVGAWLGAPPVHVALAGTASEAALMTAADVIPGYLALLPPGEAEQFPNHVAARFALQIVRYFPGRIAAAIRCPLLGCICDTDTVAPADAAIRQLRHAPRAEIKRYKAGHFDIYVGAAFERVIADQIDFLRRHVPLDPE
ncbi:MAG: alpha/beta fold hydrolase [Aquabacterium sp.]|nr:alpha/beta fold hydrolase [Aquabacterium sp.]